MGIRDIKMLKAYFSSNFIGDVIDTSGCDTCGYEDENGMSLDSINKLLDDYLYSDFYKENNK